MRDSVEAACTYLRHEAGNHFDAERVDAFLRHGPEMVEFFERETAVRFVLGPTFADYHPDAPGGTPGKYRDNRVKYLFSHVDEFADAGGIGAAFGVGAGNQTYVSTDGGQFKNAVTKYFEKPTKI